MPTCVGVVTKAVHKMLQIVKKDAQNFLESCSKNLKVAQKLLQNLNIPFYIYYNYYSPPAADHLNRRFNTTGNSTFLNVHLLSTANEPVLHATVVTKKRKKNPKHLVLNMPVCINFWYCLRKEEVARNWKSCPKSEKLPTSCRAS